MMTKHNGVVQKQRNDITGSVPSLAISKIGIVSRNYWRRYDNGYRDFSHTLPKLLTFLDEKGCDAALFSLFSIVDSFCVLVVVKQLGLKRIKAVFLEEFQDGDTRKAGQFIIYYVTDRGWDKYGFYQKFSTITGIRRQEIDDFVKNEMPKRILGNCCVLLCGETNGVEYSPNDKQIRDTFGLRAAIPDGARIVLNPIHDRMIRCEMKLKRQFLSQNGRWAISVWNKGKKDINGRSRDGLNPAWTIFHDGMEKKVDLIPNQLGVEIGILDCGNA